jgi:hypothetical protein
MSVSPANKIHINANFEAILANYPSNKQLPPVLQKKIDDLNKPYFPKTPNTSCCLQVCHAFNLSGITVPSGNWRPLDPKRKAEEIPYRSGIYYLMAVDEMIEWMTRTFGAPINLGAAPNTTPGAVATFTAMVRGLEGVMTFGNGHIELWNRYNIVQDTGPSLMSASWVWSQKPVRFWRIGSNVASSFSGLDYARFHGWWDVSDGEQYYYFIDVKSRKVTYTKRKPASATSNNVNVSLNIGDVTVVGQSLVFDWDPADGGATRETFAFNYGGNPNAMKGRSNRYGDLIAKKMFV